MTYEELQAHILACIECPLHEFCYGGTLDEFCLAQARIVVVVRAPGIVVEVCCCEGVCSPVDQSHHSRPGSQSISSRLGEDTR